ncbi:PAC2 family-domain-containing protein [Scheffersomyces xylosifermentans]|uniref:PAC2 family-domain-containing protein n=1 Tax=Scheffersomyces xylosifermentans TaxID=1304137 RepID=UPI00315DFB16
MVHIDPFKPSHNGPSPKLANSTLVIPAISIGNIPQFAIDLLIHTLDFSIIGSLDDTYLYPFASPQDHSIEKPVFGGISNAIEVYYSPKLHITVIQQRSPIIPSFINTYVNDIITPFIANSSFAKVLVLDSSDAGLVEHVAQGTIEVYTSEDLLNKSLESLKLSKAEEISLQETPYKHSSYVRSLLTAFNLGGAQSAQINPGASSSPASKADVNVLVTYVYEGDNFADSEILANKLISVLELDPVQEWVRPISWFGAYGDKPVPSAMEEGLFG